MIKTEGSLADVAAGSHYSLVIRRGELWSFGDGKSGQRGVERFGNAPTRIGNLSDWEIVFAGGDSSFAIRNGELWAWGDNFLGKLGISEPERGIVKIPSRVGSLSEWSFISAGPFHTLGISSGKLFAWGCNYSNQLGIDHAAVLSYPTQVGEHDDWTDVSAGAHHSLGVRDGKLYAWGFAASAKKRSSIKTPRQVGRDSGWEKVAAGTFCSFAIKNGVLHFWGEACSRQMHVSNGTISPVTAVDTFPPKIFLPTPVGNRLDWTSVSMSAETSVGIANHSAFFLGKVPLRLTLSEGAGESSILRVDDSFAWSKISAGGEHLLGIRNGRIVSWGYNEFGQLGFLDPDERNAPTEVIFPGE